jgi:beta-galactosidase/beta-glucuronidase
MSAARSPHVIRLRGPWDYEPLQRLELAADGAVQTADEPLPAPGRITIPADWGQTLGTDFRGRVRFVRRFGQPTNLGASERVWLVCEGVDLRGEASLNGRPLGELQGWRTVARFDVTTQLELRNELAIVVELPPLGDRTEHALRCDRAGRAGGLIGEVRLEIEPVQ